MNRSATTLAPPTQDGGPARAEAQGRRRLIVGALATGSVVAAAVVAVVVAGDSSGDGAEPQTATATVARRDLVQRDTVQGTLTYADSRSVPNYRQGTVTRQREEGETVVRGEVLYRVDDEPVVLFYGAQPAWRRLDQSVGDGADVRQLEVNLRELGHDEGRDMTIDDDFDWATREAVERWQEDLGVEVTGAVALGDVVFLPGSRRVASLTASAGDRARPGAPLMTTTAATQIVSADIEASKQRDVRAGDDVIVDLLNGTTSPGTISEIGRVAKTSAADGETTSTITFDVRLKRPRIAGNIDQAPVEVHVTNERADNVVAVPVTALLGLRGGGYGVEVLRGGVPKVIAVEPGLYSDGGYVEITRGALKVGDKVVVPA